MVTFSGEQWTRMRYCWDCAYNCDRVRRTRRINFSKAFEVGSGSEEYHFEYSVDLASVQPEILVQKQARINGEGNEGNCPFSGRHFLIGNASEVVDPYGNLRRPKEARKRVEEPQGISKHEWKSLKSLKRVLKLEHVFKNLEQVFISLGEF